MEVKISRITKGESRSFDVYDGILPSSLFEYIHFIMNEEQNEQFTYLQVVVKRDAVQNEFEGFQEYKIRK